MILQAFIDIYKPIIKDSEGETFLDKYLWETMQDVKDLKETRGTDKYWTVVRYNDEEINLNIIPGVFHGVSILGWIYTENPWEDKNLMIDV